MAKILVVEDNQLMRWSLEATLTHAGHSVRSVESAKEAVDEARTGDYRVVVTDYALTGPHGIQVLRWIKTQVPQTHVIVITAEPTPLMERQARNLGAFDFLEKPFQFASLRAAVDRALVTPERRKGPRGCCSGCEWKRPCDGWSVPVRV